MPLAKSRAPVLLFVVAGLQFLAAAACHAQQRPGARNVTDWPQHSMDRPRPPVVDPGRFAASAPPPSDATVLFDGRSLAAWEADGGGLPGWTVRDGYFEVAPGTGGIHTRQSFRDVQLHVEWSAPNPPVGEGQNRGNSGVFLMGRYEVQVLDSYRSDTYPDGMAGALYGQYPPLVNASRPPGEWNVYDIVFRAPRFLGDGTLDEPARFTVFHNGVLVQDDQALVGPTSHRTRAPYEAHPDRLPIGLQDHGHPVRFRNIWVREL
jgi:hypothetical protein